MNNNLITGVLAGVSGVLSYIFGPWDAMIMVLIAVVALDYITGVAYAAVSKTLSSVIGFKGLLKKVFIFVRGPYRPAHARGAEGRAREAQGREERYGRGQIIKGGESPPYFFVRNCGSYLSVSFICALIRGTVRTVYGS